MAILLACKRHGVFMTVRNEGDDHPAIFFWTDRRSNKFGCGANGFSSLMT